MAQVTIEPLEPRWIPKRVTLVLKTPQEYEAFRLKMDYSPHTVDPAIRAAGTALWRAVQTALK